MRLKQAGGRHELVEGEEEVIFDNAAWGRRRRRRRRRHLGGIQVWREARNLKPLASENQCLEDEFFLFLKWSPFLGGRIRFFRSFLVHVRGGN